MPELVADCPRCTAKKITLDVTAQNHIGTKHGWQNWFEVFATCRHCGLATIFRLSLKQPGDTGGPIRHKDGALNTNWQVEDYVSLKDVIAAPPPDHLREDI